MSFFLLALPKFYTIDKLHQLLSTVYPRSPSICFAAGGRKPRVLFNDAVDKGVTADCPARLCGFALSGMDDLAHVQFQTLLLRLLQNHSQFRFSFSPRSLSLRKRTLKNVKVVRGRCELQIVMFDITTLSTKMKRTFQGPGEGHHPKKFGGGFSGGCQGESPGGQQLAL